MPIAVDLTDASIPELFALYGGILRELRERKIVRTANAPTGDYAEYLVAGAQEGNWRPTQKRAGMCWPKAGTFR